MLPTDLPSLYIKKCKIPSICMSYVFFYNQNVRILCNYSYANKIDILHQEQKLQQILNFTTNQ